MRNFILTASILALAPMTFHAPPDDRGGGGGEKKLTLEEQLTAARTDLAAAQSNLDAATKARDAAKSAITTLTAERDNLQKQFDALTAEATKVKADLVTAHGTISTLTADRDTHKAASESKDKRVSNLEALCGVRGIDPAKVIEQKPEKSAADNLAQLEVDYAAAKTSAEKTAILEKMESLAAAKKAAK